MSSIDTFVGKISGLFGISNGKSNGAIHAKKNGNGHSNQDYRFEPPEPVEKLPESEPVTHPYFPPTLTEIIERQDFPAGVSSPRAVKVDHTNTHGEYAHYEQLEKYGIRRCAIPIADFYIVTYDRQAIAQLVRNHAKQSADKYIFVGSVPEGVQYPITIEPHDILGRTIGQNSTHAASGEQSIKIYGFDRLCSKW